MTSLANPFMHFSTLTDYRQTGKVTHKLSDIILLTVCGVLSGQDTWEGIVDFGEMRRDFLNHYGDFSAGIPSADTVARVVGLLNPKEFQSAFIDWGVRFNMGQA